ncbi:hypothetical protein NDU88_006141 [Pleurodeles waltl]|uniref:Uncharacterized protein n=1 Tax=Pleurodeles waltl TaxID=8319 RepID=A0AAV7TCN4_PLEWA|nr:hypothetical protein NDU88_006141 [Pleurodeles waltl]
MDQKVVEIRVDQDTSSMKETHHRDQNLGENSEGGLESKGKHPGPPMLGAHRKPQELLRGRSYQNMEIGILKIDLCQEIPRRGKRNHLTQSGHPKMQDRDKAVQKLRVNDQTKIPVTFLTMKTQGLQPHPLSKGGTARRARFRTREAIPLARAYLFIRSSDHAICRK